MSQDNRKRSDTRIGTSLLVDSIIFVSSYFPLFLILFFKDFRSDLTCCVLQVNTNPSFYLTNPWMSLSLLALSSLSLILLVALKTYLFSPERGGTNVVMLSCKRVRGDMLNFTIPFLVGLIGFNYDSWQQTAAFLTFMFFMFLFLRKDESIMLNPMFLLLNLKLHRIEYRRAGSERRDTIDVLSTDDLVLSDSYVKIKQVRGVSFILEKTKI